ncbi:MAG: hydroxymethylglutaryl-CoA lyase [Burkholderiaceae bacterium]|nr:hydroxymethylglutaryl-CoA lyase [Burkholderiaceae bacterium]
MNSKVYIQEVAPRDGFQGESRFIDTADKISFINHLSNCGFAKIEVTSFTSPKAIPALSDAETVMKGIVRNSSVVYSSLVPNVRGAQRALESGVDELNLVMSVSESHNRSNLRMSREASFSALVDVINYVGNATVSINVSLSTVFGCPFDGNVDFASVLQLVDRFAELGVDGITFCDTTGMAYPTQVQKISSTLVEHYAPLDLTMHFHNTRGMALANTLAAVDAGIYRFDSSVGGIGGCPFAPGASGNTCTEDLVHMLHLMGYDTGVDLGMLVATAAQLPDMVGHEIPSYILKAGSREKQHSFSC